MIIFGDKQVYRIVISMFGIMARINCNANSRTSQFKTRTSMNRMLPKICVVLILMANVAIGEALKCLGDARRGFISDVLASQLENLEVEKPPKKLFSIVEYPSSVGLLQAYLSLPPKGKQRLPAIIWITGGDCNSIGDIWSKQPADNDQTASSYRQNGIIMMYPSLRGGNLNPGKREGFWGEVDDVIAAFRYLKSVDYIDTNKIYLGGHSTGGTLAILVAEMFGGFAGVISFGPVSNPQAYGRRSRYLPYNDFSYKETELRSPIMWLHCISSPTIVVEGADGNSGHIELMRNKNKNVNVRFVTVPGANHFSVLKSSNDVIAKYVASGKFRDSIDLLKIELTNVVK